MKKKVVLIVILSMLFMGAVSAAGLHGTFEGYQIVKVQSNGQTIAAQDVPAVNLNGRTMVPIYMLNDLGANVEWNSDEQTVNISIPSGSTVARSGNDALTITKNIISLGGVGVTIMEVSGSLTAFTYFPQKTNYDNDWASIYAIFLNLIKLKADYSRVTYGENGYIEIKTSQLQQYIDGVITEEQLNSSWINTLNLPESNKNSGSPGTTYGYDDAVKELGFPPNAILTLEAKELAVELVEIRKTKKQSDYSVQDALRELRIPAGSIPTLATLKLAVKMIEQK